MFSTTAGSTASARGVPLSVAKTREHGVGSSRVAIQHAVRRAAPVTQGLKQHGNEAGGNQRTTSLVRPVTSAQVPTTRT